MFFDPENYYFARGSQIVVVSVNSKNKMDVRPVVPHHTKTEKGVVFNVETVEIATRVLVVENSGTQSFVGEFYKEEEVLRNLIEVSNTKNAVCGSGSFIDTALRAFAHHYPLIIRPDDLWILFSYAFARHVNANAEALRSRFVAHQGKTHLLIDAKLVPGTSSAEEWERIVFPDFSNQIKEHIGAETHEMLTKGFSTTCASDKASFEITLMTAVRKYFTYDLMTFCGIPWIELQGTLQDWESLRMRATKMWGEFMPAYAGVLIPVLDQFVEAYQGKVDHLFWQSMVKRIENGEGSGPSTTISGWINLLYPYMREGKNNWLLRWQDMYNSYGCAPDEFPTVVSSVPVEWNYFGETISLHFHAGTFGYQQDPESLALSTITGWIVSNDPPQSQEKRIVAMEKELIELKKSNDWMTRIYIERLERELKKVIK